MTPRYWTPKPTQTRRPARRLMLALLSVSTLATASCAGRAPSPVADAPRLELPGYATEKCKASTFNGSTLADLEVAYRQRGVDIAECDGRRALAVLVHDEEHRLEELHADARKARAGLLCRWFGRGCA